LSRAIVADHRQESIMRRILVTLVPFIGLGLAAPASAQDNAFELVVSDTITPQTPTATVEAWFRFNPTFYAFAGARFDVSASLDAGGWSGSEHMLTGPGTTDGIIGDGGDTVAGIVSGQIHFPPGGNFADTSNPILVWRGTWTTDDFTPREVSVSTGTKTFGLHSEGGPIEPPYGSFAEGAGVIVVIAESCYPDFNGDGELDLFDFLAFVNAFNEADPVSDCDHSGALDLFDFLCFVNAFGDGC
jgi:hypothetical protein